MISEGKGLCCEIVSEGVGCGVWRWGGRKACRNLIDESAELSISELFFFCSLFATEYYEKGTVPSFSDEG